jgi:hypothetical protein
VVVAERARRTRGPWRASGGEDPATLAERIDFLNAAPRSALDRLDQAAFGLYEALSNLTDAPVCSWGMLDRAPGGPVVIPPESPESVMMDRLIRAEWRRMRGEPALPERTPPSPSVAPPRVRHTPVEIAECAQALMVAVLRWLRATLWPCGRVPRWLLDTAIATLYDWHGGPERRAARQWSPSGVAYFDPLGMGRRRFKLHLGFGDHPVRAPRERRRREHDAAQMTAWGWRPSRARRHRKLPADLSPFLIRLLIDRTATLADLAREAGVDRAALRRALDAAGRSLSIRLLPRATDR